MAKRKSFITSDQAAMSLRMLYDQYRSWVAPKDLDWLSVEDIERTTPKQRLEMRLATWHGRQAFIVAAWNLWEHYCRGLSDRLPRQVRRDSRDSFPVWVRKCLV